MTRFQLTVNLCLITILALILLACDTTPPEQPPDFVECLVCYNNGSRARAQRAHDNSIFTMSYH